MFYKWVVFITKSVVLTQWALIDDDDNTAIVEEDNTNDLF